MVLRSPPTGGNSQTRSLLIKVKENKFLFNRYQLIDRWRVRNSLGRFQDQNIAPLIEDVPQLLVEPEQVRYSERLSATDLKQLRALDLDIILRFGFGVLRGEILELPRYGIWSFHHGDNDLYRGGPAGFWELYENSPVSGVTLQRLSEKLDGGSVLCKGEVRTDPTSPARNRLNLFLEGINIFYAFLGNFARNNPSPQDFSNSYTPSSKHYSKGIYKAPTNWQMVKFAARQGARLISRKLGKPDGDFWSIAIIDREKRAFDPHELGVKTATWLTPRPGTFLADPFLFEKDGALYIFCEQFDYAKNRGEIAIIKRTQNGRLSAPTTVLTGDNHLSFPALYQDPQHGLLMIPEQSAANNIHVYRCTEFPTAWELLTEIELGFSTVDNVLFYHSGQLWLFCTRAQQGGSHSQNNLYLYYASHLLAKFQPHPSNPIKLSLSGSRMAGSIIHVGNKILRPGQNCKSRYGGSVELFEITELSATGYQERLVTAFLPDPNSRFNLGLHTVNSSANFTVIDGLGYRSL